MTTNTPVQQFERKFERKFLGTMDEDRTQVRIFSRIILQIIEVAGRMMTTDLSSMY